MSSSVHSIMLLPGSTLTVACTDGMSSLNILNVQKLFNFGNTSMVGSGNIKFANCGIENQYSSLEIAEHNMFDLWLNARDGT